MKNGLFAIVLLLLPGVTGISAPLKDQYKIIEENNKKGLRDAKGNTVIPPRYDEIGWSSGEFSTLNNTLGFKNNNLWGLITISNKIIQTPAYVSLFPAGQQNIIAAKPGAFHNILLYGLLSSRGKVIITLKYASLEPYQDYLIASYINEKQQRYGLITFKDKILLPFRYQEIMPLGADQFALKDFDGKFAFYDGRKKSVTDLASDSLIQVEPDRAIIARSGRKGMVNAAGEVLIKPAYQMVRLKDHNTAEVLPFPEWNLRRVGGQPEKSFLYEEMNAVSRQLFKAKLANYEVLLDTEGKILSPEMEGMTIDSIHAGLARVRSLDRYGVLKDDGGLLLDLQYDEIMLLDEYILAGKKKIKKADWYLIDKNSGETLNNPPVHEIRPLGKDIFAARLDLYWALMDGSGNFLTSFKFKNLSTLPDGNIEARLINQVGVIDREGDWQITPASEHLIYVNSKFYITGSHYCRYLMHRNGDEKYCTRDSLYKRDHDIVEVRSDGKLGLFDLSGNRLLPTRYDYISDLQNDTIYVFRKEGVYGIMTRSGEILTRDREFEAVFPLSEGFLGVKINGSYGFVDPNGDLRIANRYEDIQYFSEGFAAIKLLGRWGYINRLERLKIQPLYDQVTPFKNGLAVVSKQGKWGIIDQEGGKVLDFQYDSLYRTPEDRFISLQNKEYGLISKSGKELVFPKYDQIKDLENGYVIVERNGKFGVLNMDGVIKIPIIYQEIRYDPYNDQYLVKNKPEWETIELGKEK